MVSIYHVKYQNALVRIVKQLALNTLQKKVGKIFLQLQVVYVVIMQVILINLENTNKKLSCKFSYNIFFSANFIHVTKYMYVIDRTTATETFMKISLNAKVLVHHLKKLHI